MVTNKTRGLLRLYHALGNSYRGFLAAFKSEAAIRQEIALLLMTSPIACWLGKSGSDRALLIASVLLIIIVELLNSALEGTLDRISTDHHPLIGYAKDVGSAAVLLALVMAAIVWLLVLLF